MATMAAPSPGGPSTFLDLDGLPDISPFDLYLGAEPLDFSLSPWDPLQPDMTAPEDVNGEAGANHPLWQHLEMRTLNDNLMPDESFRAPGPSQMDHSFSSLSDASYSSPQGHVAGAHWPSDQANVLQMQHLEDMSVRDSTHSPMDVLTPSSTLSHIHFDSRFSTGDPSDDNISPTSSNAMDAYPRRQDSLPAQRATLLAAVQPVNPPVGFAGTNNAQHVSFQPSLFSSNGDGLGQWGAMGSNLSAVQYSYGYGGPSGAANATDTENAWMGGGWNSPGAFSAASQPGHIQMGSFNTPAFDATLPPQYSPQEIAAVQSLPASSYSPQGGIAVNRASNHRILHQRTGPVSTSFNPTLTINPSYARNVPTTPTHLPLGREIDPQISNQASFNSQGQVTSAAPVLNRSVAIVPSQRARLQSNTRQRGAQHVFPVQNERHRQGPYPGAARPLPSLAQAPAHDTTAEPTRPTQPSNGRGGRKKGQSLSQESRENSSKCRQDGACWRCALQRDQCKEGSPCPRCLQKTTRGQILLFPCDRSKIYDFVHDFLPPSMTVMHQRQTILDTVHDQVVEWNSLHPIEVHLTCGYGRPFLWTLYEFRPRTNDLLGQFQYIQNNKTGRSERIHKYSPPFGVMKLDGSDEQRVEAYLQDLMEREHLQNLGWTFYEEERVADPKEFQAVLLLLMCTLYMNTNPESTDIKDPKVRFRDILDKTIRMIIVTYIMGHTLTIPDPYLQEVIDHVKFTPSKPWCSHTSPRLANRQLKFYFGVLRWQMYDEILKSLQQVLRYSTQKDENWLFSFCAILGLAMVLEEVQRTIWIQADAKIVKNEAPYYLAITEAQNACQRIDDRFDLLVKLFQLKYRDRKWGENGSFGAGTPQFEDREQQIFCADVWSILNEGREHLESRRNVECSQETTDLYTSRLVSRFLLPFLELPGNQRRR